MSMSQTSFLLLNLAWAGYEAWLGIRRRAAAAERRDQGTLGLLWRTLLLGIGVAIVLRSTGWGGLAPAWQPALHWAGSALIGAGLGLRIWAVRVLARLFTVDVGIRPDHPLVRGGPYRWLRHPSYSGALLAFYGLGLGLGNAASLAVLAGLVTWAFLRRIRVEEQALHAAFPQAYPAYAARTGRLFPSFNGPTNP